VKMGASFTDLRDEEEEEVDGRLRSMGPRGSRVGIAGKRDQDEEGTKNVGRDLGYIREGRDASIVDPS
jgi:hypothetical protein